MADGRLTRPNKDYELITDNYNKIKQIGPRFACAYIGLLEPAIQMANNLNPTQLQESDNLTTVQKHVSNACSNVVESRNLILHNQLSSKQFGHIYCGFLSDNRPYFGGHLWRSDKLPTLTIQDIPGRYIALGGDDMVTSRVFGKNLNMTSDDLVPSIQECIDSGIATIRFIEGLRKDVGGQIRYLVLRNNLQVNNDNIK